MLQVKTEALFSVVASDRRSERVASRFVFGWFRRYFLPRMDMWEKGVVFVAPCQCRSPAGMKKAMPGVAITSSCSEATMPLPLRIHRS